MNTAGAGDQNETAHKNGLGLHAFRFVAALAASSAALTGAALAQGEVFIDRGRLDAIAPTPPQKTPSLEDTRPAAPPLRAAPDQLLQSIVLVGEDNAEAMQQLETRLAPLRGKPITQDLLRQMLGAVSAYYKSRDLMRYRAVVPDQSFDNGRVQIVVLKAYIAEIDVEGLGPRQTALVKKRTAPLLNERPLTRARFERVLLLLADVPGLSLAPRLEQSARDQNAVRLKLSGRQRRVESGIGVQNGGQELLGGTQIDTSLAFNSSILAGDRLQIFYGFPSEFDQYQFWAGAYGAPIGDDGLRAQIIGSVLRTDPGALSISGRAKSVSAQLSYPLMRSMAQSLTVTASLDALNSDNAFLGQTIADERTRVTRGALAYSRNDGKANSGASATLSVGIAGLGARVSSVLGGAEFIKANVRLAHAREIAKDTTLSVNGGAQLSGDRLPASERLQFGGQTNGRGFASGYASSTRGITATGELARALPKMTDRVETRVFAFTDGAHLAHDNLYGLKPRGFASVGVGVGATFARIVLARVELAKPVSGGDGGSQVLFTLKAAL